MNQIETLRQLPPKVSVQKVRRMSAKDMQLLLNELFIRLWRQKHKAA